MKLLERDAYLNQLAAALHTASDGTGCVFLVSGEAGIGKTALIERFVQQQRDTVRVLWGACDALFTPRPLGPLYDMAAALQGDIAALLASDTQRATIFATVLAELQQYPTIAVFEDVHWADEATLDLLRYLGRRIARTRALLVLTYRDDELGLRHPLRLVLGDIASAATTRRMQLGPLSVQAVQALIGARAIDATRLHQQTGGNPFFVTEVLANSAGSLPPTVRDAVLARTAQLSPTGQAVLQTAAVLGPRIEPWLLAAVTGTDAPAAAESLSIDMLQSQGEILTFRHELARQTILESISPLHRIALHRLTLRALKTSSTTQHDLARMAHHAHAAHDSAAVLEYAPAAARQAAAAGAHREAVTLYALALRFADDLALDQRALLLEAYARECNHVGQQREGITARRQAIELWRELDNPLKQGENLARLMRMLVREGQNAEAQRVSHAAVEMLEALPAGHELALAYRVRATISLVNRDYAEALAWAEKARVLAERFEAAEVLATVHITIGTALLFVEYARGCAYLEHKLELARAAGLDTPIAHMYTNLGSGSGELYHFDRAEEYLARGIAYAAERDLDSFRLYMLAWQALINVYLGHWHKAIDGATTVLKSAGVTVISRITALVALGRVYTRRGDAAAQRVLDEALELATHTNTIQRLGLVRAARAEAAWHAADREQTLIEASAVYDLAASKQHPWFTGELAFWRWRAGDAVGLPDWVAQPYALQIAGDWRAAAQAWQQLKCPYEQARALADGDSSAQLLALEIYDHLGAQPAAEALRQQMREAGIARVPRGPRAPTRQNPFGLTARQMDVLTLLTEHLTNAEIAARLHISPKTVDHHVSAVLGKLNVSSRDEAAALARQHPNLAT